MIQYNDITVVVTKTIHCYVCHGKHLVRKMLCYFCGGTGFIEKPVHIYIRHGKEAECSYQMGHFIEDMGRGL